MLAVVSDGVGGVAVAVVLSSSFSLAARTRALDLTGTSFSDTDAEEAESMGRLVRFPSCLSELKVNLALCHVSPPLKKRICPSGMPFTPCYSCQ